MNFHLTYVCAVQYQPSDSTVHLYNTIPYAIIGEKNNVCSRTQCTSNKFKTVPVPIIVYKIRVVMLYGNIISLLFIYQ